MAMGDDSVIPYADTQATPRSANRSIIDGGTALPPTYTALSSGRASSGCRSRWCSSPSHTVGTPPVTVTASSRRRRYSEGGSTAVPGMTILQPTSRQAYGSPQPATCMKGTVQRTVSAEPMAKESFETSDQAWRRVERCENSAPLGWPVVPEV